MDTNPWSLLFYTELNPSPPQTMYDAKMKFLIVVLLLKVIGIIHIQHFTPPPPNQRITLRLVEDHIIPEAEADAYRAYGILSLSKGELVMLKDGDLSHGLPPPNEQYVRVVRKKDFSEGLVALSAVARV